MDTQPLKLQVDSKQAQADLSALAKALEITLTSRGKGPEGDAAPMCGEPAVSVDGYLARKHGVTSSGAFLRAMRGEDGIRFFTQQKMVTERWPEPGRRPAAWRPRAVCPCLRAGARRIAILTIEQDFARIMAYT